MFCVYIAGAYRARTKPEIDSNIAKAVFAARELRQLGYVCIVPHLESMFNETALDEMGWLGHGLELLSRCDAVFLLPGSEQSRGAQTEATFARENDIPVLESIEEVNRYASRRGPL